LKKNIFTKNFNLSNYTTIKVGGVTEYFAEPSNLTEFTNLIRVLRNQNSLDDGVTGASHTATTAVEEDPRKFKIDVGFTTEFDNEIDLEY